MTPPSALCAAHPDVVAVEVCGRCGTFICAECLMFSDDTPLCAACHQQTMTKPSSRAIAALILGVVGFSCFLWPLGLVAWFLAVQERHAIDAGQSPIAGKGLTTAGKVLGMINLGLMAVAALVVLVVFLKRPHW